MKKKIKKKIKKIKKPYVCNICPPNEKNKSVNCCDEKMTSEEKGSWNI